MLIASGNKRESDAVVAEISTLFEITDNGKPTFHLGCGITCDRSSNTLKLDQKTYTLSILREFGYDNCNPVLTPMDPGTRLTSHSTTLSAEEQKRVDEFPYGAVVGKCMYLSNCTHPDISYTVRELAGYMVSYGPSHVAAAKHLLRYLKGTVNYGWNAGFIEQNNPTIRALCNSDWGMGEG